MNGRVMHNNSTINLVPGTTLSVKSLASGPREFAPELALFASDRPGVNLMQARRMALEPFSSLELRSDGKRVARARVNWSGKMPASSGDDKAVFVCWLNGNPVFVRDGEALSAVEGDQLILEGMWGSDRQEVVNLKGFVAIPWANNGQDLGWEIILDPGNFMGKYSMPSKRPGVTRFRVVRERRGHLLPNFTLISNPEPCLPCGWLTSVDSHCLFRGLPVAITGFLKVNTCLRRHGATVRAANSLLQPETSRLIWVSILL